MRAAPAHRLLLAGLTLLLVADVVLASPGQSVTDIIPALLIRRLDRF